jgi:hypothetical protein
MGFEWYNAVFAEIIFHFLFMQKLRQCFRECHGLIYQTFPTITEAFVSPWYRRLLLRLLLYLLSAYNELPRNAPAIGKSIVGLYSLCDMFTWHVITAWGTEMLWPGSETHEVRFSPYQALRCIRGLVKVILIDKTSVCKFLLQHMIDSVMQDMYLNYYKPYWDYASVLM